MLITDFTQRSVSFPPYSLGLFHLTVSLTSSSFRTDLGLDKKSNIPL